MTAHLASNKDSIDPMENAIGKAHGTLIYQDESGHKLIKEYPLSKELLAMTRVLENVSENNISVSAKGAPETIFRLCKLNENEKNKHLKLFTKWLSRDYRVIAVANASHQDKTLPKRTA